MNALEYIQAIAGAKALISEGVSALRMMNGSIAKAKDLAGADKETLLREIREAQKLAGTLEYPEDEI